MPLSTVAAVVSIAAGLATAYSALKPAPKAPALETTPVDTAAPEVAQRSASDRQRRQALAAQVSGSTILTSPTGLGKSILGG